MWYVCASSFKSFLSTLADVEAQIKVWLETSTLPIQSPDSIPLYCFGAFVLYEDYETCIFRMISVCRQHTHRLFNGHTCLRLGSSNCPFKGERESFRRGFFFLSFDFLKLVFTLFLSFKIVDL